MKGAAVRTKRPSKNKGAARKSAKPEAKKPAPLEKLRADESTQVLVSMIFVEPRRLPFGPWFATAER